jgi:hypothetical protein
MATGGIALNGSSQYLRLNSRVVSAFPFTLVCWVAAGTGASSQMVFLQQQSNADRYSAAFLNTIGLKNTRLKETQVTRIQRVKERLLTPRQGL